MNPQQRLHGEGGLFVCISQYKIEGLFHSASLNKNYNQIHFEVPKEITTQEKFRSQSCVCPVRVTGYVHCTDPTDTAVSTGGAIP